MVCWESEDSSSSAQLWVSTDDQSERLHFGLAVVIRIKKFDYDHFLRIGGAQRHSFH